MILNRHIKNEVKRSIHARYILYEKIKSPGRNEENFGVKTQEPD